MLSLEEIRSSQVEPAVVQEAYQQAVQRLADALDTKKAFEQKASTLFTGYITIALALFSVGGALIGKNGVENLTVSFWVTGALFGVGAFWFVTALRDREYGALGSEPNMWLVRGVIDGDDTTLPYMLAYLTYYYQERIDKSAASNDTMRRRIRSGVYFGFAALLAPPIVLSLPFIL